MCGITRADLCIHPRGRLKFGAGSILDGIKIESFGFSAPIGFGKGQVRALKHSEGAPSSCSKAYGDAESRQAPVRVGKR